jgi:hypothetical protein
LLGTLRNDQFGATIPDALDLLAACEPAIEVIGVTDWLLARRVGRRDLCLR